MKPKETLLSLLMGLIMILAASAQEVSDTLRLKEIEVKANFPVDHMGFKRVRLDSTILMPHIDANLSTILSQYSTIFIKSYGNNNLATPSFRGTTAHHTQIEWNGININSPMLGQTDLSQVPVSQFDGIEILYGAAGIARSSGAFGGIVNLTTKPDWNNRLNVTLAQTFASFNNYSTNLNAVVGNANIQSHTKVNFNRGKNDFRFYNDYTQSVMNQINSSYLKYGFSEDLFAKINNRHLISAKIWYSHNDTDIPPVTTNINPDHKEKQRDRSLRSLIEYKYVARKFNISMRSALVDQYMNYVNDSLEANHHYYSFTNRFRFQYTGFSKVTVKPGLDLTYDWVNSDAYDGQKRRYILGGFAEIIYVPNPKLTISFLAREDLIDGRFMPFIPAIGVKYKPFHKTNISFSGNIARNYRYPTLNDLYWDLFGNPDLLPEISYIAEMGITWNLLNTNRTLFIEAEITGYYSFIEDMIVWLPSSGSGAIWKPMNITEVLARGIETGINGSLLIGDATIQLNTTYNFCRSTYEKTKSAGDASLGKQLIYIPVHSVNATLRGSLKDFYFSYTINYVSKRYTGTDNQSFMPGYNLSNIFFGKNFQLNNFVLSLQLEINNLFDLDYQSIANRPMPGRNFAFTIRGIISSKSDQ
ncbi:MAG: TonB-dependent receptor plug domain-containing protein [Bacteroidales bacterium]|nr:TonB-dependent receptor plug domain-containing protein [Bacteroidales bacterium]